MSCPSADTVAARPSGATPTTGPKVDRWSEGGSLLQHANAQSMTLLGGAP
jgi:hypothetical protein